jgi:antitoxin VapB
MALKIRNARVERLAAQVSALTGESKTEGVRRALEERLARLYLASTEREADVLRYLKRRVWPFVPQSVLGRRLTRRERDRTLGYGRAGV